MYYIGLFKKDFLCVCRIGHPYFNFLLYGCRDSVRVFRQVRRTVFKAGRSSFLQQGGWGCDSSGGGLTSLEAQLETGGGGGATGRFCKPCWKRAKISPNYDTFLLLTGGRENDIFLHTISLVKV